MKKSASQGTLLICNKHAGHQVKYICSFPGCESVNICELCLSGDPAHVNSHQHFIYSLADFLSTQDEKFLQKALPNITSAIAEIEKKSQNYSKLCEDEAGEVDKDFGTLFKIFFSISEKAKTFLKDNIKGENDKIQNSLNELKKEFKDISTPDKHKDNFLSNIFSSKTSEFNNISFEELIPKLIQKNSKLNKLRAGIFSLLSEIESAQKNRVMYKVTEESKAVFEEIRENFDNSCKEMYRQFKSMFEGGNTEDMKKSIFLQNQNKKAPVQRVTIDLMKTPSTSNQNLNESVLTLEKGNL